jgi:hypothetical protein
MARGAPWSEYQDLRQRRLDAALREGVALRATP